MKNENYYGIGSDEYATYRTTDNGRTWELISAGGENDFKQCNNRIIYGSDENKGLRYSDDGGMTKLNSNVRDGNWDGIEYQQDIVFAHSMDGRGIYFSKDVGEYWEFLAASSGGETPPAIRIIDNKIFFEGDTLTEVAISEDGEVTVESNTYGATVLPDGSIKSKPIIQKADPNYSGERVDPQELAAKKNDTSVEAVLVRVLNDLFLPQMLFKLTGQVFSIGNYTEGITLGDLYYKKIYSSDDLFVTKNIEDTYIDFEQDLGMQPMSYNLSEILEKEVNPNDITIMVANLERTDELKNTEQIIDGMLDFYKEAFTAYMDNIIKNTKTDATNLFSVDGSQQEFQDAVKAQKTLFDVEKGAMISTINTIINSVFSFPLERKISLIKTAIFEALSRIAPRVNYQLRIIKAKGANNVSNEDFLITYDLYDCIQLSLKKYLDIVFENIQMATTAGDKGLISIANDKYQSLKDTWLEVIEKWLLENYQDCIVQKIEYSQDGIFDAFEESYNNLKNKMAKFLEDDFIISNDWFSEEDYDGSLNGLEPEDIFKVYDYYQVIFKKFKSRCIELLELQKISYASNIFDQDMLFDFATRANLVKDGAWKTTLTTSMSNILKSIIVGWSNGRSNI